ncbi:MAG: nitroreductase family protein [Rhodovulum sp.]|nr:nitroreductase family protein [Paracoccaceae bacterium]MCC0068045.1 nitroreductase family protein [Rhodovulum sp.]
MASRRTLLAGGATALAGAAALGAFRWRQGASAYESAIAASRAALPPEPGLSDLVRYATLAANGHNTQPWRFAASASGIAVTPDFSRRTPVVDPDDHHLFASLGCAAENLSLAARAAGRSGTPAIGAEGIEIDLAPAAPAAGPLFAAIPHRQSTRSDYDGSTIDPALVDRLIAAAAGHGVEAIFISEPAEREAVLELVVAGNTAQLADPAFVRELKDWIRFSPAEAARRGDGLFAAASGNPALPDWAGRLVIDRVLTAEAENARYVRQIRSSSGLLVLVGPSDDPPGWMRAGLACQRLSLLATAEGLKLAFVNQAVEDLPSRTELRSLLGLGERRPNLVLRIGRAAPLPFSPRRPVEAVLA